MNAPTPAPATTAAPSLSPEQCAAYLARIGVRQPVTPDLAGLTQLHRAHLLSFTWETLDAFMGWPQQAPPATGFDKLVRQGRGGWCYEMNGLFGAALTALGFQVTRLCGGVDREKLGPMAVGNHLTLRVDLDQPYLAEVGVGDAILSPTPMRVGSLRQRGFAYAIEQTDDGWLRFRNHRLGVAPSFDFRPDYSDEAAMAAAHAWLMQDKGSPFANALAMFRHRPDGYVALKNATLRHVTAGGVSERQIVDAQDFAATLAGTLHLAIADVDQVWRRIKRVETRAA